MLHKGGADVVNTWNKQTDALTLLDDDFIAAILEQQEREIFARIASLDINENPISWGMDFAIQISAGNDKWEDLITKERISWVEMLISPNENGITEMQLDWSKIYGKLNLGTYRIVKYNGLSTIFSDPFEVK